MIKYQRRLFLVMVRRKREELSEGKKQIIAGLLDEYDIKSAEDIQRELATN